MTKNSLSPISDTAIKADKALMSDAQHLLFGKGVQIRMLSAIIICIFFLILPYVIFYSIPPLCIACEFFFTVPLLYGLPVMARKAADGKTVSIGNLFAAFSNSKQYWQSVSTAFWYILLAGIPVLLLTLAFDGALTLYAIAQNTSYAAGYAPTVLVFGLMVCAIMVPFVLLLEIPAYFMLSLRAKDPKISCFRAMRESIRLLSKDTITYMKLQLRFLWLDLVSCISVCTLFPIYTIPMALLTNAVYLDRLQKQNEPTADCQNTL